MVEPDFDIMFSHRRNPTSTTTPLTINESARDTKGKKRAAPETDDEDIHSTKRIRTSAYSLRSITSSANPAEMPRKARFVCQSNIFRKVTDIYLGHPRRKGKPL